MLLERSADVDSGPLRLDDVPVPEPGSGQVLVRVRICGVCRTDLHIAEGDLPLVKRPIIPGHETVGIVDRTGAGVRSVKEGDRVGIAWLQGTCGRCEFCRSGRENLCIEAKFTGYQIDGGFAELAVADARFALPLPASYTDLEVAPLLCAGLIGYRALRMAGDGEPPGGRGERQDRGVVGQEARHNPRQGEEQQRQHDAARKPPAQHQPPDRVRLLLVGGA